MFTMAFDEFGQFEERALKQPRISMIAGFLYDDKDIQGERENELLRIREYLISVCNSAGGSYPGSLHHNRNNNNGRSAIAEKLYAQTLAEFINKGTFKGRKLSDKERRGKYYVFSYCKTKEGKDHKILGEKSDTHSDILLSNLYIRMVNDVINRMIFSNPMIENVGKVYFDLPTRVYIDANFTEEEKSRYISQGYYVRKLNGGSDLIYLTSLDMFRSAIEREIYHSTNRDIEIAGLDVRQIAYELTNGVTDEDMLNMGFLYMSDLLCAVSHKDKAGRKFTAKEIGEIPGRIDELCDVQSLSFFYDKIDTRYAMAYDCIKGKRYTRALEYIYVGMHMKSEGAEIYRGKWFPLLLDILAKSVDPQAYSLAVTEFKAMSKTNNIEQNKLVFIAQNLEKMQAGIEFTSDQQKSVLFEYYQTAATAYNHLANTVESNRCIKNAKKYLEYVSMEKQLEMKNIEAVSLCDSFEYPKAVLCATKVQKAWDAILEVKENYFGVKDVSLEARKAYSQLGQVYAFAGDPRAEMCFIRAMRTGRDVNSLITMSFLLHYYAEQGMKKKYDTFMKEYCDGKEELEDQFEYIIKEGTKDKNPIISMKFALSVFVRGVYLFHLQEAVANDVFRDGMLHIEERIISISDAAKDQINGHPWELIYKYLAFIAKEYREDGVAEEYLNKAEEILKQEEQVPEALLKAIIQFGKLEYNCIYEKGDDTKIKNQLKKCWNTIKDVNHELYDQYKEPKTRSYENLCMIMTYMYH